MQAVACIVGVRARGSLGWLVLQYNNYDPLAVPPPLRPAILPHLDRGVLDLPKEADVRLQAKSPDIVAHSTRVNPTPTLLIPKAPPKKGEGGAIAVYLPTSSRKIVPEHQTVSRTVR